MKAIFQWVVGLSLVVGSSGLGALAHDGEKHSHTAPREMVTATPAVPELLRQMDSTIASVRTAVSNNALSSIHADAELLGGLIVQFRTKATPENSVRLEGVLSNMERVVATLHRAGDAGNGPAVAADLKRIEGLRLVLANLFP